MAHLRAQLLELRPNIRRHDQIVPRRARLDLAGEPVDTGLSEMSAGGADIRLVRPRRPVRARLIARQSCRLRDLVGSEAVAGRERARNLVVQFGSCGAERASPARLALAIFGRGQSDRQERDALGDGRGQPEALTLGTGEPCRFAPQFPDLVQQDRRLRVVEQSVEA
jgi:hypothetical protein